MATLYLIFGTEAEAAAHVAMLGASAAYDPTLPRCDSYRWGDPDVEHGARCRAVCPCTDRSAPDPSCPYRTTAAADVLVIAAGGAVKVIPAHAVIGYDTSGARALTDAETQPGR